METITIKKTNGKYPFICLYGKYPNENGKILNIDNNILEQIKNNSLDKVLKILEKLYLQK